MKMMGVLATNREQEMVRRDRIRRDQMGQNLILDQRLSELVNPDSEPEKIAGGFVFTEGPLWNSRDRSLIFSDVQGDAMYRWTRAGGSQVFRQPSATANGNTFDQAGNLITCEHQGRRVSRTLSNGSIEDVADQIACLFRWLLTVSTCRYQARSQAQAVSRRRLRPRRTRP